ncbi:hypothetical protein C8F04DRAFT_1043127 [Mycena alexandri]|uniref:Beta-glucuronidase C-terminal domain-containing protein n=1 Tax=Mycena alexandri TaxID=1745969 RepID=A0AAD6WWB6_9AGAR|nr:hypothetical protein C8F04DRAFT_1043127 [Mycena alexandri]
MKLNLTRFLPFLGIVSARKVDADAAGAVILTSPTVKLQPPTTAGSAQHVSQGFVGFGMEGVSLPQFGGVDHPNDFSNNLMSAISTRTGAPIHIQVGGTSMDNIIFNASSDEAVNLTDPRLICHLNANRTIGSPWLSAFKNFNPRTRFTLQVPLARNHPVNRLDFARACIDALPNGTQQLDAIEIGNEPNLYPVAPSLPCGLPDRPKGYGPDDYSAEWKAAAKNLTGGVDALNGQSTWYQAMTFSTSVTQNTWNVQALWNDIDQGGFVRTVSQHYYQTKACSGSLKDDLMNHSKVVSDMQSTFGAAISFLEPRGVPFILGEVGTAVGSGCIPPSPLNLYRSLGAALWTADFMLNAMSMGIQRVSMMQGTNFSFSAWQPVTTAVEPKAVHGNWYGHVFAADFIGTGGDFQIYPLPINNTHPNVVSYAGYNSGLLTKLAVLDMRFWKGTNDNGRPAVSIELTGLDSGITGARVSRLTAPGGSDQLLNISWAGKRWSAEDDGQEPKGNNSVVVNVINGSLAQNVTIFASQAVMLEMIRRA